MSQQDTELPPLDDIVPESMRIDNDALECEEERFEVIAGEQSGTGISIENKAAFSVGNDFNNDVVLRSSQNVPIQLNIERYQGVRHIQLQDGNARLGDVDMQQGEWYELVPGLPVEYADVAFHIQGIPNVECADEKSDPEAAVIFTRRSMAVAALLAGIALLGVLGIQEFWLTGDDEPVAGPSLVQQIAALDLADVQIVENAPDGSALLVSGRVSGREQYRHLQQLLATESPGAALDVQVDSDIVDGLLDIYRNHGIAANVSVLGKGHVQVETEGVDEATMVAIEKALETDLPMLNKLDVMNTPPEESQSANNDSQLDPEKEIEAVVAGEISYVITRDQARYFVGAVLPSGHTIKAINEGMVVMLREGEETQLKF